jgi:hypothetical protein
VDSLGEGTDWVEGRSEPDEEKGREGCGKEMEKNRMSGENSLILGGGRDVSLDLKSSMKSPEQGQRRDWL